MAITLNGTTGITTPALDSEGNLEYSGTLTGGTGVVNIGSGQVYKDASGNVGIGTSLPGAKLNVAGTLGAVIGGGGSAIKLTNTDSGNFASISAGAPGADNNGMDFSINGSRVMYIDALGRLVLNDTLVRYSSTMTLRSSNSYNLASSKPGTFSTGHFLFENDNGAVGTIFTSGGSTSYNTTSDYRLKENLVPITGALARVAQIPVYRFNFKADPDKTVDGFVAHELANQIPEATTGEKDAVDEEGNPVYQGVDQSKVVPLLTAAVQELLEEVSTLKTRIEQLETQ